MAQYKVIQDIEAEDKLLGPLSLRQFIYAGIVIVVGFIAFQLARAAWFLAIPFLPPMIFFGLLAAPFGQNQSSEVWLLAKIRYFLFPRKRIWDQTGLQELVRITVPKRVETNFAKGYSATEVTSRLKALANTLDSRGWAIKNVSPEMVQNAAVFTPSSNSDRLLEVADIPPEAEASVRASEDVLNEAANPVAGVLAQKLDRSSETHRKELLEKFRQLASQNATSVQSTATHTESAPFLAPPKNILVHPKPTAEPDDQFAPQPIINNAGDVVHLPPQPKHKKRPAKKGLSAMTTPGNTAILDDVTSQGPTSMNVPRTPGAKSDDDGEVIVSLR